jgi:hypothetical protein
VAQKFVTNAEIGREFTQGAQQTEHSAAQIMAGSNATAMCAFALADIRNLLTYLIRAVEKVELSGSTDGQALRAQVKELIQISSKGAPEPKPVPPQEVKVKVIPPVDQPDPVCAGVLGMVTQMEADELELDRICFNRVPVHLANTLRAMRVSRRCQITEQLGNSLRPLAKKQFFRTFNIPTR